MSEHTKEPWLIADVGGHIAIGNGKVVVCRIENTVSGRPIDDEDRANARRIVACVNACVGISTDDVEQLPPTADAYSVFKEIKQQRDELLAALKACADAGEGECNEAWFKAMELARAAIAKFDAPKSATEAELDEWAQSSIPGKSMSYAEQRATFSKTEGVKP